MNVHVPQTPGAPTGIKPDKIKDLKLVSPKEPTEHHLLWLGNGKTSMPTFPNVPSNLTSEGILDNFCAELIKDKEFMFWMSL